MTDIPLQDLTYLQEFKTVLADIFLQTFYEGEDPTILGPMDWAEMVTDLLQDAGWRMVTAQDWKEMTAAWMFARLR